MKVVQIFTVRPLEPVNTSRVCGCSQARRFTTAISDMPESCPKVSSTLPLKDLIWQTPFVLRNSAAGSTLGSRSASLQRLPGKQYRSCWRKVDTGWVLVSVLIFCRKVSKSVVLSVRFPSFSLSWVIFISIFCFVTCRQNGLLTVY